MKLKVINLGATARIDYEEKLNRDGWITWGRENDYPKYLQSLMDKSSKHNVSSKSLLTMNCLLTSSPLSLKPPPPIIEAFDLMIAL